MAAVVARFDGIEFTSTYILLIITIRVVSIFILFLVSLFNRSIVAGRMYVCVCVSVPMQRRVLLLFSLAESNLCSNHIQTGYANEFIIIEGNRNAR